MGTKGKKRWSPSPGAAFHSVPNRHRVPVTLLRKGGKRVERMGRRGKWWEGRGEGRTAVPWISCPCSVPTPTPTPTPLFGNCLPQLVDVHVEGRLMIEGADPIGSSIRR